MNKQQLKLLNYSYDLLAARRYTIRDMIKKLDAKNQKIRQPCTEKEIEEILASLIKSNFLNDKTFAEFFIDAQTRRKPTGIFKLKQQLKLKGIDPTLIDQTINAAALNEKELAKELLQKKLKSLHLDSPKISASTNFETYEDRQANFAKQNKIKQKLFRFLQSNGFPTSVIFPLLEANSEEEFSE